MGQSIEIFCCVAEADRSYLQQLVTQLAPQLRPDIKLWEKSQIRAGADAYKEIHEHLNNAQIFLLLISPDFLVDSYCYDTVMRTALQRHANQDAMTIPVIVRPAHWRNVPILNTIQAIPRDGKPISGQRDQDKAFWEVAKEIDGAIQRLREPLVESGSGHGPYGSYPQVATGNIRLPTPRNNLKISVLLVLIAVLIVFSGAAAFALFVKGSINESASNPISTQTSSAKVQSTPTRAPDHSSVALSSPQLPFTFQCVTCDAVQLGLTLDRIDTDSPTQSVRWIFSISNGYQKPCNNLLFTTIQLTGPDGNTYQGQGQGTGGTPIGVNGGQSVQLPIVFAVVPTSGTQYSLQAVIIMDSCYTSYDSNAYKTEEFTFA